MYSQGPEEFVMRLATILFVIPVCAASNNLVGKSADSE